MAKKANWRNRIVGSGDEPLDAILFNPANWRIHPKAQQEALEGVLSEVGWVQNVIINKTTGHLVDGHLRCQVAARNGEKTVPVVYVELDENEEALILASLDPLAAMAATDKAKLDELLHAVQSDDVRVQALMEETRERLVPYTPKPWVAEEQPDVFLDPSGDGVDVKAGFNLGSFRDNLGATNDPRKHMLELPPRPDTRDNATVKLKYSRTNAIEVERCIKAYMRPGDVFFEMCCGWMTFSSSAKYFGFSGKGGDIWNVSIDFCRRQIDAMPGAGVVEVVYADCRDTKEPDNFYDFVHSNPPFFSLEPYGDTDEDLASLGAYDLWLDAMGDMGREALRILKPGGLANFVINDYRKGGVLIPMHADFINSILKKSGLILHDLVVAEVISQALRFRKHDYERRRTVKCHEYVITFKKPE